MTEICNFVSLSLRMITAASIARFNRVWYNLIRLFFFSPSPSLHFLPFFTPIQFLLPSRFAHFYATKFIVSITRLQCKLTRCNLNFARNVCEQQSCDGINKCWSGKKAKRNIARARDLKSENDVWSERFIWSEPRFQSLVANEVTLHHK